VVSPTLIEAPAAAKAGASMNVTSRSEPTLTALLIRVLLISVDSATAFAASARARM
jgi:hypothetical protein